MVSIVQSYTTFLIGTWRSDVTITASDRRLKQDVTPLQQTLKELMGKAGKVDSTSWLLRELRPVSFKLNDGSDLQRFGFIAQVRFQQNKLYLFLQDLERLLPNIVRDASNERSEGDVQQPIKAVVYQDLIAVLTVAVQKHEVR